MSAIDLFPETDETGSEGEVERVADPLEKYGAMEYLLIMESLLDHFDEVENQLNTIRMLIEEYDEVKEKHKTDLDMDQYVDEYAQKIRDAFENFAINNKKVDIGKLSKKIDFKDIYNHVVLSVNDYIEANMIGSGKQHLYTM
jgi:hypothetical protein